MKTNDFNFALPEELIARYPLTNRSESRLLALNQGAIHHHVFSKLPDLINENDLVVLNNTRVIPARFFAKKITGGKIEILIERIMSSHIAYAHVKANKSLKLPCKVLLENNVEITILNRHGMLFELEFNCSQSIDELLAEIGQIPLPSYMQRNPQEFDKERYQTVYAEKDGAIAAPTAGLHFDQSLLEKFKDQGIKTGFITLHVGAGTFKPVTVDSIYDHQMHHERFEITQEVCELVNTTKAAGGRVIAVGTTTVRALETAMSGQACLLPTSGETNIFIYPGYRFRCIDALITNFHLPKSTLLMLVCAFGGYQDVMASYENAIKQGYRFYSYGDAMLVFKNKQGAF